MRPTPIPAGELEHFGRIVVGPPDNDPAGDIRPIEVAIEDRSAEGLVPNIYLRWVLEDGDLERLERGDPFYVVIATNQLAPIAIEFLEEP